MKYLVIVLALTVFFWLGHPWDLKDGNVCQQGNITSDCGSKAFYHRSISDLLMDMQYNLIKLAIGKRPVFANVHIDFSKKAPAITLDGINNAIILNDELKAIDDDTCTQKWKNVEDKK